MSDLIVSITPETVYSFTASELLVRVIGGDPIAGTTDLYIEVKNSVPVSNVPADPNDYVSSASGEFIIRLNATVNSAAFNAAVADSNVSAAVATHILQRAKIIS